MKTHKFLFPLATLVAAFTTEQVVANVTPEHSTPQVDSSKNEVGQSQQGDRIFAKNGQDQFSFVLKRNAAGQLMAWHWSHSSHSSHQSHSSHSSHYSGW